MSDACFQYVVCDTLTKAGCLTVGTNQWWPWWIDDTIELHSFLMGQWGIHIKGNSSQGEKGWTRISKFCLLYLKTFRLTTSGNDIHLLMMLRWWGLRIGDHLCFIYVVFVMCAMLQMTISPWNDDSIEILSVWENKNYLSWKELLKFWKNSLCQQENEIKCVAYLCLLS